MRNTLHTQIRNQLTKPRPKPRTDDMRQMFSDLQSPAGAEDGFATSIQERKPVSQKDIWQAFKKAAKPGVTTETDHRFVKDITFTDKTGSLNPGTSALNNMDGVPLQQANFRNGFSLTAEETGLRVSGSITGFLSGVRLHLTEEGLHLSNGQMDQTIQPDGSQRIRTEDPGDQGKQAEVYVTPQGRVNAKLSDGTIAGRRKTKKKSCTITHFDHVGNNGELKVGDREFAPFLKFQDMDHIREIDAERTVSDARSEASFAESLARPLTRSHYGQEALFHARNANQEASMANRSLSEGRLNRAETLAVRSLDSSSDSAELRMPARREIAEMRRRRERERRESRSHSWGSGGW